MLDRTKAPEIHLIGDLQLPAVNEETLDNGIILRSFSSGAQPVCQLLIAWRGGTCEAMTNPIAGLAADVMLEGTTSMSGVEISEALDFRGAVVKIASREHFTILSATFLNSMAQGLLPILRDIILHPLYEERLVDNFKTKQCKMLELNSKRVEWMADQKLKKMIMGEQNLCARTSTPEIIMRTSRDEIVEFQHRITHSKGCQAFLSGMLTPDLLADTRNFLSSLPQQYAEQRLMIMEATPVAPQTCVIPKADALQSAIMAALPAPDRTDPDYIPLRYAVTALGGYFGSRLMLNIREEKGFTYGIYSYLLGSLDGGFVQIAAQADNKHVAPLLVEIRNEIEKLATIPMEEDEMMRLKQYLASKLVETLESPFNVMTFYEMQFLLGSPADYFDRSIKILKDIDAAMIMNMTRKYLKPDDLRIVVAGNASNI